MLNFGLPEMLMLFEKWQRAPNYVMKQVQTADVMKKDAERLLDLFTGCFSSSAGGVPELGLGPAETKVVATAWNRHLLLYHNGNKYSTRSWINQGVLYHVAFTSSTLSIFVTSYPILAGIPWVDALMLVLPIIAALLGTISTRLRQRQKFAAAKMASYEIVSEIYKFRVRAMQYDQIALAAQLAAAENAGKDKKDEDEMPKPISGKQRDKVARDSFVDRVKMIYTGALTKELSSGTAISHSSQFGLDPARLLHDGDEDSQRDMKKLLEIHVSNNLYFIKNDEWKLGAENYKEINDRRQSTAKAKRRAMVVGMVNSLYLVTGGGLVNIARKVEDFFEIATAKRRHKRAVARGEASGPFISDKYKIRELTGGGDEEAGKSSDKKEPSKIQKLQAFFNEMSNRNKQAVNVAGEEVKVEKLEESYIVQEDVEEGVGGGGGKSGDNLLGPLTIDEYYDYRARPFVTYLERTAPWRAFELQLLEILIFVFNSFGAVLVGLGMTPYVPMTVAISSILSSFIDFTNLNKQVEAYNEALRNTHNVMNEWGGKTRTERRTRATVTSVVGTVEAGMMAVALALTNGSLTGAEEEGEGEGEEGDDG